MKKLFSALKELVREYINAYVVELEGKNKKYIIEYLIYYFAAMFGLIIILSQLIATCTDMGCNGIFLTVGLVLLAIGVYLENKLGLLNGDNNKPFL